MCNRRAAAGDYWPGEAENLLSNIAEDQRQSGKKGSKKGGSGKVRFVLLRSPAPRRARASTGAGLLRFAAFPVPASVQGWWAPAAPSRL